MGQDMNEVQRSLEDMEKLLENIHNHRVIRQSRTQPPRTDKMSSLRRNQCGKIWKVCRGLVPWAATPQGGS